MVAGEGGEVEVDLEAVERGVAALAQAALRHGGLEQVELRVDGATHCDLSGHCLFRAGPARRGASRPRRRRRRDRDPCAARVGFPGRGHAGGQAPGVNRGAQVSLLRWLRRQLQQPTPTREHLEAAVENNDPAGGAPAARRRAVHRSATPSRREHARRLGRRRLSLVPRARAAAARRARRRSGAPRRSRGSRRPGADSGRRRVRAPVRRARNASPRRRLAAARRVDRRRLHVLVRRERVDGGTALEQ